MQEAAAGEGDTSAHRTETKSESNSHKSFLEIFGQRKRPNGEFMQCHTVSHVVTSSSCVCVGLYTSSKSAEPRGNRLPASMQLLQASPHVLPPPTSLCGPFMRRLLPPPDSSGCGPDANGDEDAVGMYICVLDDQPF